MEAQLSNAHQVHERAMGKLKSDLHRKQTLLTAAQEQAGRLRSDLQQVLQDNEREHVSTQGKCHAAKSQLAYAKKILQLLVNTTVDLCRLLLRTTNYMQSGKNLFSVIWQYLRLQCTSDLNWWDVQAAKFFAMLRLQLKCALVRQA